MHKPKIKLTSYEIQNYYNHTVCWTKGVKSYFYRKIQQRTWIRPDFVLHVKLLLNNHYFYILFDKMWYIA